MSKVTLQELQKTGVEFEEIKKLSSNLTEIGGCAGLEDAEFANEMQNNFPLMNWLAQGSASRNVSQNITKDFAQITKEDGVQYLKLPSKIHSLDVQDTTGECCFVPFDYQRCDNRVPVKLLCMKECQEMLDYFVNRRKTASAKDADGVLIRTGDSVNDANLRNAQESMYFLTMTTAYTGVLDAETPIAKPFHGLQQVVENDAVTKFDGSSLISAMKSLNCLLKYLRGGDLGIWVHPEVYDSIVNLADRYMAKMVNGLNQGTNRAMFSYNASGVLLFKGIPINEDKFIPIDQENATGSIYFIDRNQVGIYLDTTPLITDSNYIFGDFEHNNVQAEGCGTSCNYMYNWGAVFSKDYNYLAVVENVPLDPSCALGEATKGLQGLVVPQTLIPAST